MKILKRIKQLFTRKNKVHPQHGIDDVTSKQCVICYENTVSTPIPCCKQPVCAECIAKTRERNPKCPCCRRDLPGEKVYSCRCVVKESTLKLITLAIWITTIVAFVVIL